jgi:DNA-binding GntR family transcriptional regulator
MPRTSKGARAPHPPSPPAGRVQRKTISMLTLEAIRDRILHGDYPEGTALRQDALAAELGVSRIPVREALRQLEAEGMVTFRPHVGAVVSSFSLDEIRELFELRAVIEADLLRRAFPHLTEAEVGHAERVLDQYETALAEGDVRVWGTLNWQFHSTLYLPARHPISISVVQQLHNHSDRYQRMQLKLTHGETRANREHRAILGAVREREEQHAISLLSSHILGAGRGLVEFLRKQRAPLSEGVAGPA